MNAAQITALNKLPPAERVKILRHIELVNQRPDPEWRVPLDVATSSIVLKWMPSDKPNET